MVKKIYIFGKFEIIIETIKRREIFYEKLAWKEMTSEADSWWWRCWGGEQNRGVGKGHLGLVFAFKLCQFVSQTTFPTQPQNHALLMPGESLEKKKEFWNNLKMPNIKSGESFSLVRTLKSSCQSRDKTILRNKAVTLLPIFSLNNKFNFSWQYKESRRAFEGGLVRFCKEREKSGNNQKIILGTICHVTPQTVHICHFRVIWI